MIAVPGRLVSAKVILWLAALLALSLAANGKLFWELAQAEPEAALECTQGALDATVAAEKAEDARDDTAGDIARTTDAATEAATTETLAAVDVAKQEMDHAHAKAPAVPAGTCPGIAPPGVRDELEALRDRANRPAG